MHSTAAAIALATANTAARRTTRTLLCMFIASMRAQKQISAPVMAATSVARNDPAGDDSDAAAVKEAK
jgi:hypothetical protein